MEKSTKLQSTGLEARIDQHPRKVVRCSNHGYDGSLPDKGANAFNHFITMAGLVDLPLEGYSYTWAHKSASKMSKLDRFLISEELDKKFNQGKGNERLVNERSMLLQELQDLNTSASLDMAQKAKIRWSIEGDENSKYFHEIINKKRYWNVIDQEVVNAVSEFFLSSKFPPGCNSSFITLIPKTQDAKVVKHFRPISLIGLYKGIHIDESLTLSHLFYADDAVFVGKWDKSNLITIVNVLKCFFLASGLKINLHKSKLMGIGIPQDEVTMAANFIGCNILSTPFNYLGVKVGGVMSKSSSWEDVLAKISSRLSKWKLKTLSIGGRLTLIKSVLSSMPLYQMFIYKVPVGVLNRMESFYRISNIQSKMTK
ncbi:RNA-directed DNA polymerase, eukaryota [Tanacetum coccineum]